MNVCKIPNSFVNSVCQRLTAYLNAEYMCLGLDGVLSLLVQFRRIGRAGVYLTFHSLF